jgi:hypothetical protein
MMEVSQAANRLKQLLAERGFDMDHPRPRLGWDVFKQFANEPGNSFREGYKLLLHMQQKFVLL